MYTDRPACIGSPVRRQTGLTLMEVIMFMIIVGIALAAIVGLISTTSERSADPLRRKQALMIAEGLLEEVQLAKFTYCDLSDPTEEPKGSADCTLPEVFGQEVGAPGGRPFDNVNDYVAASGVATRAFDVDGALTDANGERMNVEGYTASVAIQPAPLGGIAASGNSADVDVLRIRVVVDYDGEQVVLDGFRTRYAPTFQ